MLPIAGRDCGCAVAERREAIGVLFTLTDKNRDVRKPCYVGPTIENALGGVIIIDPSAVAVRSPLPEGFRVVARDLI
jgi:hypothetical protein